MNKIRIKDITKDLGVGNKEMLQILRELGIQVKSQMGTLSDEEAGQVRARVRQGDSGRAQIVDTEVQPGVIVRRRKAAPPPPPRPRPPRPRPRPSPRNPKPSPRRRPRRTAKPRPRKARHARPPRSRFRPRRRPPGP